MDTRFLETFLIAVDSGSIAEAARRLNLTAAAVAKRIRALESEIGPPLITRSGRTIRPTASGTAIIERARHFVVEAHNFKSIATTDRPAGQLRLGAYLSALSGLLPDMLASMQKTYPQIDVYITIGNSAGLYHQVLDGDGLDAAIIAEPPFAISKSCEWRLLREEPLIVLTRAPVASRRLHALLASEPFIRLDRNIWPGRLVDGYLRKHKIRPRERFEINDVMAIAVMVDRGLGVSLLPDFAPPWPEGLSVVKIPVAEPSFTRRIGLVWRRASPRLRLVHAFLEQAAATRMRTAAGKTTSSRARRR